jgi:hypothetical protein
MVEVDEVKMCNVGQQKDCEEGEKDLKKPNCDDSDADVFCFLKYLGKF